MKLPFTIHDSRFAIERQSAPPAVAGRQSSIVNRKSQRGVALIITLILLSVTLVMALAFLAISRRENSSVTTQTDTDAARLAADAAQAAAEAQIAVNILSTTNPYNFGLLVSTNYINYAGFDRTIATYDPANVNYDYLNTGGPLSPADFLQNLANLYYAPRPPVFIPQNGTNDFRYYLDLNRNGCYDTNGVVTNLVNTGAGLGSTSFQVGDPEWIGVLEHPDQPYGPNNKFIARFAFIAQPIGNSLDLNAIHNQVYDETSLNPQINPPPAGDVFLRNQGVGSWEINLAAFLADLNNNEWDTLGSPYQYNQANPTPPGPSFNTGAAFDDARALLAYRYANNYNSLAKVQNLFGAPGRNAFLNDGIDDYSDGPLQTTLDTNEDFFVGGVIPRADNPKLPWAGSDNTNHFFDLPSDLFTQVQNPYAPVFGFSDRLLNPGTNTFGGKIVSTYDRYTFYRMLAQLGTDSQPDSGKINLNYSNAVVSYALINGVDVVANIAIVSGAETNFVRWRAQDFFLAAADRMLKLYTANWFQTDPSNFLATYYAIPANTNFVIRPNGYGLTNYLNFLGISPNLLGLTGDGIPAFGITNIPVWIDTNFVYSPAVNRVLQLAANLYDATTTNFYPSVFRPVFEHDILGNVFIVSYTNLYSAQYGSNTVNGITDPQLGTPYDVSGLLTAFPPNLTPIVSNGVPVNVYGVPWIIGAKKYLPAFNQASMVNAANFERRLQVARASVGGPIWTNQAITLAVDNDQGVSFWNSYNHDYPTNYPGNLNLTVYVSDTVQMVLTNSDWGSTVQSTLFTTNFVFLPTRWPGSQWRPNGSGTPAANSFLQNYWTNTFFPATLYSFRLKQFVPGATNLYDTSWQTLDPLPQFGLLTTNWLQTYILDTDPTGAGHVIDYVQLRGPISSANLNNALKDPDYPDETGRHYLWSTNVYGKPPGIMPSWGIINQIDISSADISPPPSAQWKNPGVSIPGLDPISASRVFFAAILSPTSTYNYVTTNGIPGTYNNTELAVQAPYTAVRTIFVPYLYQVNDPLVHDLASDLDTGAAGDWSGANVRANGVWVQSDNGNTPFPLPPSTEIAGSGGRYQPWSRTAPKTYQTSSYDFGNPYNLIYKDPLVWSPDYWDFPTNLYPTAGWIGRVHRGTPWQTVYLKASDILRDPNADPYGNKVGTNTWSAWTGDSSRFDTANSAPVQDRLLFDLFTSAPDDNATRGQLSVNQTNFAAWSALFSSMVAMTNNLPDIAFNVVPLPQPSYGWTIIQPAGVNGLNSVLGNLVTNINNTRLVFTNADGLVGEFEHKGDILSVAALTEQSPFLNWTNRVQKTYATTQQHYGIGDEVYEWLPQQMMSLVQDGGPRYVIYAFGQGLKPAPGGIDTANTKLADGQSVFGMVTNYQVVSEMATRTVVRLDTARTNQNDGSVTVTPPHAVIESFNVLPPD